MIKFKVSLDAALKNSIAGHVQEHLARTLTDWSAGKLTITDMEMESVDAVKPYVYYYRHIPSGEVYSHNFVTSEWAGAVTATAAQKNQLPS
jgi:hypothetical protein